ncbi:class I SAM-dependent methyltransferase [Gilvimarinus sp. F26214L]|uniref:class I SAM-dependent methyltransferase n=1 Tax=Gilvimarinus sp. DZF01 TaxID=3461371 RepID=UPI004045F8F5
MLTRVKQKVGRAAVRVARQWAPETLAAENAPASGNGCNHQMLGLTDAVRSGWYLSDSAEVFEGFKIVPEDVVVDVGCGDGLATHFCARHGAHVAFSDIDPEKVEGVRKLIKNLGARKIEGVVSDSSPLPFPDGYATKVLAMEMLEHTEDPASILSELVRVGKPGALYLITVPDERSERVQKPFAADSYFEKPNHIQIFSKADFVRLVEGAGLKVENYRTWGFYWTLWWCLSWLEGRPLAEGPVLDTVTHSRGEILNCWSHVWNELLKHDGTKDLVETLNGTLPKSQLIIARKR